MGEEGGKPNTLTTLDRHPWGSLVSHKSKTVDNLCKIIFHR